MRFSQELCEKIISEGLDPENVGALLKLATDYNATQLRYCSVFGCDRPMTNGRREECEKEQGQEEEERTKRNRVILCSLFYMLDMYTSNLPVIFLLL